MDIIVLLKYLEQNIKIELPKIMEEDYYSDQTKSQGISSQGSESANSI